MPRAERRILTLVVDELSRLPAHRLADAASLERALREAFATLGAERKISFGLVPGELKVFIKTNPGDVSATINLYKFAVTNRSWL